MAAFDEEVARIQANSDRLEKIVNQTGGYTPSGGGLRETWPDLYARLNAAFNSASSELVTRVEAVEVEAENNAAAIVTEQTARVNDVGALSEQLTLVVAQTSANAGAITSEQTARANGDSALASQITTVAAQASTNAAAISTEQTARANGDSALASSVATVEARLNSGDFAAVKSQSSATADAVGGLSAQYVLQVQTMAGGALRVAGLQLASGSGGSSIVMLADKLLFVMPDGSGTPKQVVVVGNVDGVATVGIDGNVLVDGSVRARSITVDQLSALSANLGSVAIAAGGHLRSGQTSYNVGTGFWLGQDGGVPKFSIGADGGNRLTWDGSKLQIVADYENVTTVGPADTNPSVFASRPSTPASAVVNFNADGTVTGVANSTTTTTKKPWYTPTTSNIGNQYKIRFNLASGDAPTGGDALDTWHALSSTRSVGLTAGVGNALSSQIVYEIARNSDSAVVSEGAIRLNAEAGT